MDFWATKTPAERVQEEDERLVRPNPADKPPRRDLRREDVQPDKDPDADDPSDKKDRSRNYKKIADRDSLIVRYKGAGKDRIPAKSRETGETVMISPDTLKKEPGKYKPIEQEDESEEPKEPSVEENKDEGRAEKRRKRLKELQDKEKAEGGEKEAPAEKPAEKPVERPPEDKPDSAPVGEGAPEGDEEKRKYYQDMGDQLHELAGNDPKLKGSLDKFLKDPENPLRGILKGNRDVKGNPGYPVAKFFPGIKLPKGLNTIGDLDEALKNASPKPKPGKGKKTPSKPPAKPAEGNPEGDEALEGEEAKPEPTLAEKAGIAPPKRRPVNAAEQEEALSQLVDTFSPEVAAEFISKKMHPDDVHSLVKTYKAAQKIDPKKMDDVISKASKFYQTDPESVPPPMAGKNAAGQTVSFDNLNPEEQSEATRQHQLQIAAMSLAAKHALTAKLSFKGGLTGKPRIPSNLASSLAGLILTNAPADKSNEISAKVFDSVLMNGTSDNISDGSARQLLAEVKKYPAVKAAATAYLQANDYAKAKDKFLKGDDDTLSEWQYPHEILQGLRKANQYFDDRSKLYGNDGSPHPAANYFRLKVMSRLRALDPKKASLVASKLPELEAKEYKDRHRKWEAQYKDWSAKNDEHDRQVEEYANNPGKKEPPGAFEESEPVEPKAPPSMEDSDQGDIWDQDSFSGHPPVEPKAEKKPEKLEPEEHAAAGEAAEKAVKKPPKLDNGEVPLDEDEEEEVAQAAEDMVKKPPKLQGKQASDFTYLATPVMGKTAVYHGIDPYAYGPAAYPGWLQPHQRDIGEADFKLILGMADDWLKSPLLSVAVEGMEPDARYRAALDLAIYDSPYNRALNAPQYNQLLAKLAGETSPGLGETLLTIRKATSANFKTETRYLVVYGSTAISRDILAAVEAEEFPFKDEDGKAQKNGHVAARLTRTIQASELPKEGQVGETVVRIDFPQGSEAAALRGVQAALTKFQLTSEKTTPGYLPKFRASSFSPSPSVPTGGSTPMKASQEIRKFAAEVAKTNSKLAFDMLASADRIAEEEKKMPPWLEKKIDDKEDKGQQKEAGIKAATFRSLVIKQAASVEASQRGPWLPVLQALKDLG